MSLVKFSDVVRRANTKEDKDNTDKIYYVGGEHIDSNNVLINKKGIIAGSTIGPMFYFGFKEGQVLFVSRNPHLRKTGMVTFDGICSEKTFVLETIDENILKQRFLPFLMQSNHFWNYMEAHKSGSVNFFINWSTLANYEFELPTVEKQQELLDILWAINDAKVAYEKMIISTDELIKSQFIEMFGNQKTNPLGLISKTLGEICEFYSGTGFPNDYQGNSDGMYPFYKVGDISRNVQAGNTYLVECDNYINDDVLKIIKGSVIPKDTVVFAKIGEALRLNRRAITTCDCLIDNNAMGIRPKDQLTLEYFFQYMKLVDMGEYAGATAMPSVRKSTLESVQILVPDIDEQIRFSEMLKQSDKSKFELKENITRLEKLMQKIINDNMQ